MNNSKIFRLFISSTFNDFRREREILQTEVFPKIKAYARGKGYTFQLIDLRWGINEEAQLNQKTLDLCLEEVRRCKYYPHPNFLVMLGDRYGWVPLPYAIEKHEFEAIRDNVKEHDEMLNIIYEPYRIYHDPDNRGDYSTKQKESKRISKTTLLEQWYTLDENHIPTSYILNERDEASDYKVYENWEAEESALREILQGSVERLRFDEKRKRKYVMSATEAEIEEGILPYIGLTEEQKKLLESNEMLQKMDVKYIFAFLRHIKEQTVMPNIFCDEERSQAHALKKSLKGVLPEENVLEKTVEVIDETTLEESYLATFKETVYDFLKAKIDEQIEQEDNFCELDLEKEGQAHFAQMKREDFLGQEENLKRIEAYINSTDTRPFVLYGTSGKGKSALMAQAIHHATQKHYEKKVLYHFVGASPHANTMKEILISLFSELGKDIRVEDEKYHADILENDDKETFQQFSQRVHDAWQKIERETVIFIDAVDQLIHDDTFLWLPSILPKNVKIVISVLKDSKYEELESYFEALEKKTTLLHKISDFNKPLKLLEKLLEKENRCIQEHQKVYFLKQYNKVKSPLYVTIVAQEMKHWKSYDSVVNELYVVSERKVHRLADSQEEVILEFVRNLSRLYLHNEKFVERVLGYLYASRDGLSESELLELISSDKDFIKKIAPNTWHINKTKEFPLVMWTRLYSQLKPFLSLKSKDREELMFFFHREFKNIISKQNELEKQFQYIIVAVQDILQHQQEEDFFNNRWGKLLIILEQEYLCHNYDFTWIINISKINLELIKSIEWINSYIRSSLNDAYNLIQKKDYKHAMMYHTFLKYLIDTLYKNDNTLWIELFVHIRKNLASVYQDIPLKKNAINLLKENIQIFSNQEYRKKYVNIYLTSLLNLSTLVKLDNEDEAHKYLIDYLDAVDRYFSRGSDIWHEHKMFALIYLGSFQDEASLNYLDQALKNITPLFERNQLKWIDTVVFILYATSVRKKELGDLDGALEYINILFEVVKPYLTKSMAFDLYKKIVKAKLLAQNLLIESKHENNNILKELIDENLNLLEFVFNKNQEEWINDYLHLLDNSVKFYQGVNLIKAIELKQYSLDILESFCNKDPMFWQPKFDEINTELMLLKKSIKRNSPCPCGSGRKYKKCCG